MPGRKVRDWPADERPRERLERYGAGNLSDAQLLAILLRTGGGGKDVMTLAIHLLDKGLDSLDVATFGELKREKGVGTAKAAQIKAALELGRRLMAGPARTGPVFSSGRDVYDYFASRFKNVRKESLYALLLDVKNRLISECHVSKGTLSNSLMHPREAFTAAIRESAAAVIFVHNHPSGDPEPSRDDIAATERLKSAGDIVGIAVLDHVIVGEGRYVSLKERGVL